jgi:hypothetical protein
MYESRCRVYDVGVALYTPTLTHTHTHTHMYTHTHTSARERVRVCVFVSKVTYSATHHKNQARLLLN